MSNQNKEQVEKTFAIYETSSFEMNSPLGPRVVRRFQRVGEQKHMVPVEALKQLAGREFDTPFYFMGIGNILVQSERGEIYAQPINFVFDETVKQVSEAFDAFDSHLSREIQRLQEEQDSRRNKLQIASEATLNRINEVAAKSGVTPGGLVIP